MNKLYLAISAILLSNCAMAEDNTYIRNGNIYSNQGQYFVGAGVVTGSELFKGQDKKSGIYFNGGYHGEDFNIDGSGINYRFMGDNKSKINLSTFIAVNPGFEADDADILKGMKDRDLSADLGLNIDFNLGKGTLSTKFQHDVTGKYKGYQADVTYFHPMNLGFAELVPYVGAHYYSKDYTNYYVGVSSSEATEKRPAYNAGGTLTYKVGYALVVPMTENINITQTTGYSRLGSDMANSPLIDSKNQWATSLGMSYSF